MIRLSGLNLYMKKLEMEEEGFIPIGLDAGINNTVHYEHFWFQKSGHLKK